MVKMNIFSVKADSNDIEVIMHEVRRAVQRWEGGDTLPLDLAWVQHHEDRLLQAARQLRILATLDGNAIVHSTRPHLGPWIIRFQQFIRRITWWFLEPILQQIRAYQLHSAQVVETIAEHQETLLLELQRLAPANDVEKTSPPSTESDSEG